MNTADTIHIMLDLETWGKRPGCDPRSIGATVFYPDTGIVGSPGMFATGDVPTFYVATDNPVRPGLSVSRTWNLHRDPETVQWWSEQSEEAQAAFADPVPLDRALAQFGAWLVHLSGGDPVYLRNVALWAHGPQFDVSILEAAYHAVGLPVPWHYRAPRDTRTAFDMAGIDPGPKGDFGPFLNNYTMPGDIEHHALHDAIIQARAVCAAYAVVRGWRDAWNREDAQGYHD